MKFVGEGGGGGRNAVDLLPDLLDLLFLDDVGREKTAAAAAAGCSADKVFFFLFHSE